MKKIDEKLNEVYEFTLKFIEENGFPPSVRDICSSLSIKSTATAYSYIERLKEKGLLDKSPLKKRAITLPSLNSYKSVPIIGTIRAGYPIFAVENLEGYLPLPSDFDKNEESFALKVSGNSMINAGINDGDLIIVKKCETADNGEIVVALIDDSATVKRFYKKKDKIVLHPENDELSDMIYDDVQILGIVTGLLRKF